MRTRKQINIRPEQCARTHGDGATINEDAVEVDKDSFAQLYVEPIIHFDGCLNPGLVFELFFVCDRVV